MRNENTAHDEFRTFASEIQDMFGTIKVVSRMINDVMMETEYEIDDNPKLDIEAEKRRIKSEVVSRIEGVLSEFVR